MPTRTAAGRVEYTAVETGAPAAGSPRARIGLRATAWFLLFATGLVHAWFYRHMIFSDGISYLEIASNYARGDWVRALNDYWSPLYSWVLALALKLCRPAPYWHTATLHAVNFAAFFSAIVAFELFLTELIAFQRRVATPAATEITVRIAAYSTFMWAGLHLIGVETCSPDMIAMALLFLLSRLLLRIERGATGRAAYIWLGVLLGAMYLDRSAFLPVAAVYLFVVCALLQRRGARVVRPAVWIAASTLLVSTPFITALSIAKGRFTMGTAGRLNYAWEICGAARSIHWQGEPYDIGVPKHPTTKVSTVPPAYTFDGPVPGSYPLWYEPTYWYEGIAPHFELLPQLKVLGGNTRFLAFLFLASPVGLPTIIFLWVFGWREWLSPRGIFRYWFLLLPVLFYMAIYCIIFVDRRYVAASLEIVWVCLIASLPWSGPAVTPSQNPRVVAFNRSVQVVSLLFCLVFLGVKAAKPAALAWADLTRGHEAEWNLQGMMAERFRQFGVRPGDRIAYIGDTINADWPRLDGARIVGEVPAVWARYNNLTRFVTPDHTGIRQFWQAPPGIRAGILEAFRQAGASIVVADEVPPEAFHEGWQPVIPPGTRHLPWSKGQLCDYQTSAFLRLGPAPPDAQARGSR